jgi:two-component system, chemotaxis family, chemotaxis protein CheY
MMKVMRRAAPFYGRIATPEWLGKPAMARILIVDDEEEMRRVIDIMLKHAGHDTASAEDGHDALLQFRQQRFDLVICDIFMPNKEGLATLRELRRLNPTVPVIMMSGGAPSTSYLGIERADYLEMAKRLGATRTIKKPFKYSQLDRLVRDCLAAAHRRR